VEGNDIVHPAGPHDHALVSKEEMLEAGVGLGMAAYDLYDEEDVENGDGTKDGDNNKEFDWMDFRLKFGCQSKVRTYGWVYFFRLIFVVVLPWLIILRLSRLLLMSSIHRQ